MPSKKECDNLYMDIAERISKESKAKRLKVGAVIVKNSAIISYGYNGTPKGDENCCESTKDGGIPKGDENIDDLVTVDDVVHAEMNALLKLVGSTENANGCTLYVTHSPCMKCAQFIHQTGVIFDVIYKKEYRNTDSIDYLISKGINVTRIGVEKEIASTAAANINYINSKLDKQLVLGIDPIEAIGNALQNDNHIMGINEEIADTVGKDMGVILHDNTKQENFKNIVLPNNDNIYLSNIILAHDRPDIIPLGAIAVKAEKVGGLRYLPAIKTLSELPTNILEYSIVIITGGDNISVTDVVESGNITYAVYYNDKWVVYKGQKAISPKPRV
jgi:dCMP deaminase